MAIRIDEKRSEAHRHIQYFPKVGSTIMIDKTC